MAPTLATALLALAGLAAAATRSAQLRQELAAEHTTRLFGPSRESGGDDSAPNAMQPLSLYEEVQENLDVTCVTQVCDCSWATGGPLGFCSTIGCPCKEARCWNCCCKELFPEEYRYAMGMRYFPPMAWWMYLLWFLLTLLLLLLIGGSCFVLVYYFFGMDEDKK